MEGEGSICVECKKVEKDASKMITCMYCFTEAHFKCRNLLGHAARRLKDKMYFCSHNCSSIYQRITEMQNHKSSIVETLAAELKGAVSSAVSVEMKNVRTEVHQITTAIERSQQFLSDKFETIVTDFQELKKENEGLKQEIDRLKHTQHTLSKTVHKLEHSVDKSAREANCNNAVVLGVPFCPGEDTLGITRNIIDCYGSNVGAEAIVSADRLGGKNKSKNALIPIRVLFKDGNTKETVFSKKKEYGKLLSSVVDSSYLVNGKPTSITIRDELTPLSLELLSQMREYQEKLKIKYVWTSRGGNVLVKKTEHSKPEMIKTRDDLYELVNRYSNSSPVRDTPSPKRKCNNSSNN